MTDHFIEEVNIIKQKLDNVSSSFCLAKWYQVTIHLQNGHTHSCHHPGTHKVPLDELINNPTAQNAYFGETFKIAGKKC